MKMMRVWVLSAIAVSFRSAWDIIRAWSPMNCAPISPSISALGVRAATESTTMTEIMPERTRLSRMFNASSPLSGWEIRSSFTLTPNLAAYSGSRACSASMNAALPPLFCARATQGKIKREGTGGNDRHVGLSHRSQLHYRAFAEFLLQGKEQIVQLLLFVLILAFLGRHGSIVRPSGWTSKLADGYSSLEVADGASSAGS